MCDLVGSTALAAQVDPEEWRETVAGYQRAAAEAITRFDGFVARYVGDGVLAFFGYPEAHDNDAERAVRASLALLEALERLNQQPRHAKLSARIGINSGPVVVGGVRVKSLTSSATRPISLHGCRRRPRRGR
jgi:class 3 adenylate cyclase